MLYTITAEFSSALANALLLMGAELKGQIGLLDKWKVVSV